MEADTRNGSGSPYSKYSRYGYQAEDVSDVSRRRRQNQIAPRAENLSAHWITLFEETQTILEGITVDICALKTHKLQDAKDKAYKLSQKLQKTNRICDRLGTSLSELTKCGTIKGDELSRRRSMLEDLTTFQIQVHDLLHDGPWATDLHSHENDRELAASRNDSKENDDDRFYESLEMDDVLYQYQHQEAEQDKYLDEILEGVGTLKLMSNNINLELEKQTGIVGEIEDGMHTTQAYFQNGNVAVDQLIKKRKNSGRCCGMFIIFVLFIIIILLLFTDTFCALFNKSRC